MAQMLNSTVTWTSIFSSSIAHGLSSIKKEMSSTRRMSVRRRRLDNRRDESTSQDLGATLPVICTKEQRREEKSTKATIQKTRRLKPSVIIAKRYGRKKTNPNSDPTSKTRPCTNDDENVTGSQETRVRTVGSGEGRIRSRRELGNGGMVEVKKPNHGTDHQHTGCPQAYQVVR